MRILSGIVTLTFILVEVLIPLVIHGFLSSLILRCEVPLLVHAYLRFY